MKQPSCSGMEISRKGHQICGGGFQKSAGQARCPKSLGLRQKMYYYCINEKGKEDYEINQDRGGRGACALP